MIPYADQDPEFDWALKMFCLGFGVITVGVIVFWFIKDLIL